MRGFMPMNVSLGGAGGWHRSQALDMTATGLFKFKAGAV